MVFACQKDSFLKDFTSSVVSCTPGEWKRSQDGKKETIKGFEVILEDTIIFPEGGGQPCDYGTLNEVPVLQVVRRGAEAVHFTEKPLQVGEEVKQTIDWDRRLDHMQQHSGQHLLTAVIDNEFGYPTTAWWLGEDDCHIELDTLKFTEEQKEKAEAIVNAKIRECVPVKVEVFEAGDPSLDESRTRGLPKDHVGSVRVITIEGVDSNMCCGTHVSNLSQLQMVKILNIEKGKKGKINLHFLVGGRVLKRMALMLSREQGITNLLNNGPATHIDLIEKLQKSAKLSNKNLQGALKEIILYEVKALKSANPKPEFYSLHRKDAEVDFINTFIKELNDPSILLLLTVGEEKGAGHMVMYGDEEKVSKFGQLLCSVLDGKGNGKGNKFQAKVKNLSKLPKAIELIQEGLKALTTGS